MRASDRDMDNDYDDGLQQLTLVQIPRKAQAHTQTQLDEYIGIVVPFEDSINTLLNLKHITDPDLRYVYWRSYSFGRKKRGILWGVYDKFTQKFSLDGACNKYDLRILNEARRTWKRNSYIDSGNSIIDRVQETMSKYLPSVRDVSNEPMIDAIGEQHRIYMGSERPVDRNRYIRDKYILAYYRPESQETREEYDARYDPRVDNVEVTPELLEERFGEDVIGNLEKELAREVYNEQYVPRGSKRTLENIYDTSLQDTTSFDDDFLRQYEDILESEDFVDLLIKHLNKITREVRLYERTLNRTDMNNYIAENVRSHVMKILDRFYEFLKSGVYTSDAYLDALEKCPYLSDCEWDPQETCAVYFHGQYSNFKHENDHRDLDEYTVSLR